MRLSEAIRLGSTMKPQAYNGHAEDGSCALRAAADAVGMHLREDSDAADIIPYFDLRLAFPILRAPMQCPAYNGVIADFLEPVIYHLNDSHKWTREQIADFIELHEPLPVPEFVTEETQCQQT